MQALHTMMRGFTIRSRMRGAIALVLALFALVGATGVAGGVRLGDLSRHFMEHSIAEATQVTSIGQHLAQVKQLEKQMVIEHAEPVAVMALRDKWLAELAAARKAFEALLEGEEDEDNKLARESLQALDAYARAADAVVQQFGPAGPSDARSADRLLADADARLAVAEGHARTILRIVGEETAATQHAIESAMQTIGTAFLGVLALTVLVVVPLTLLNSASITGPIAYARSVAQRIAAGDLSREIRVEGGDEAAELLASLRQMQEWLQRMVGQVRATADSMGWPARRSPPATRTSPAAPSRRPRACRRRSPRWSSSPARWCRPPTPRAPPSSSPPASRKLPAEAARWSRRWSPRWTTSPRPRAGSPTSSA